MSAATAGRSRVRSGHLSFCGVAPGKRAVPEIKRDGPLTPFGGRIRRGRAAMLLLRR
jgi:hypothetical protein